MMHKHRSNMVTQGPGRAAHRAFLRATGLDTEELEKSFVGIVSSVGGNTPCSKALGPQADNARLGVAEGGGVPVVFSTISVSDGTWMNHDGMRMGLVARELIADSIEVGVRAHAYEPLVGFAGLDKTLPAVCSERLALARRAGKRAMEIIAAGGPLPRALVMRRSLDNACAAVATTGGSTNAAL